jgi:hypothetical protein
MNRFTVTLTLLMLVAGAALAAPAARKAATTKPHVYQGEIWDKTCAKQGTHDAMASEAGIPPGPKMARECTLECHEMGSPLVLYNPANQRFYILDDQDKAKTFAGEKVKVTGTLDTRTNTIQVSSIAAGS